MNSSPKLLYFISGMWCSTCSRTLGDRVSKLPGVASAEVNFASKLLSVRPDPAASSELADRELQACVHGLGFGIKKLKDGWLQTFLSELDRERTRAISGPRFSLVFFLAMWSSMLGVAAYMGGLAPSENLLLSTLSAAAGIPAILLGIAPFARAGLRALVRSRALTLDLFITIGGLSACGITLINLVQGISHSYADSASMILVLLLLAKVAEGNLARYLCQQLIAKSIPKAPQVRTYFRGEWQWRDHSKVRRGDRVQFEPGQTVSFDGRLTSESGLINRHLLNGEPGNFEQRSGEPVYAGCIARSSIEMEVVQPLGLRMIDQWAESALIAGVRQHAYSQTLQSIEKHLTALALSGAVGVALFQFQQSGEMARAAEAFFIAILVLCPCLFASILPLSKQMAHLALARAGIMVLRAECLFDLACVAHVYLDKTGTLEAVESEYQPRCRETESQVRAWLDALSRLCRHPVLTGLNLESACLPARNPENLKIEEFPGEGVRAWDEGSGESIWVGRDPVDLTSTVVLFNGQWVGTLATQSTYNEKSLRFLEQMLALFPATTPITILSGDPAPDAGEKFTRLNPQRIRYHGNLSPLEKTHKMEARSLFIGDGLNDLPALSKASVGCRLGGRVQDWGTADLTLPANDLAAALTAIRYSRHFVRILTQTAGLALVYNVLALSLAATQNFTPLGAALAMLTSAAILTLSSLRLLKVPGKS